MDRDLNEDLELFEKKLTGLINEFSLEGWSDTPDFILASYLRKCLETYNYTARKKAKWYGRPISIDETCDKTPTKDPKAATNIDCTAGMIKTAWGALEAIVNSKEVGLSTLLTVGNHSRTLFVWTMLLKLPDKYVAEIGEETLKKINLWLKKGYKEYIAKLNKLEMTITLK